MASRATDSDGGGSLTPSEQSGEERSDCDSDYETDDGEEEEDNARDKNLNIIWTGYAKRTPVILFNSNCILQKKSDLKIVGERYHLAFKFGTSDCKIIRTILHSHGFHEVHPNSPDFNLMWTNAHLKPFTLRILTEFQKINHFPRSYELTRKDRLFKNLQRMQQIKGARHFDFVPQSYVLPTEYQEFCTNFLKDRGPWIVKPVASSRGRGVFLVNHPDQVPLDENLIVCRYIDNPLVIDGFKFDIRLYVAVTSYDPLVIYLYEEGLTRFATVKYEKSSRHLRNQCMHLTNYSINKKNRDYVKNDDPDVEDYGNKWSMGAMLRYLRSLGKDTTALMMKIEEAVIKTILSVELSIATACKMFMPFRGNCFELYGFDVLVDESFKPWVLEVNLSPSLACDSPLDLKIKGNMLCDLFSLVGIVCHDPLMRTMVQQSRRNQETVSKISARTKSAFTRPLSARPKNRPLSASSSTKTVPGVHSVPNWAGLNSEEIKILRRVKEEEQRQEGWIRIFPGPDTWDIYGSFLQFNTTHNLMLHQRLYPERHKVCLTKMTGPAVSSAIARTKNACQQITNAGHTTKLDLEKTDDAYTQALVRAQKYERKLGSRSRKQKIKTHKKGRECRRIQLVQGVAEDDEDVENQSCEEEEGDTRSRQGEEEEKKRDNSTENREVKPRLQESTEVKVQELHTQEVKVQKLHVQEVKVQELHSQEVKVNLSPAPPPTPSPSPSPAEPRYNVVELLVKGMTLTKVQARSAFAAYLLCVQHRLLSEVGPLLQEDVDALNEQMDLVLRFLKRAAVNLQQTFRVCVPSRKLPLGDRRRILAKQLGDFVYIYNKETGQFKDMETLNKQSASVDPRISENENKLEESKFGHFVSTASEAELEEVLTTYTKLNKSASIFLGSSSKHPSCSTRLTQSGGSDDKTSCPLETMLPHPDTQPQQHKAAEGDSNCHTRLPGSGEDHAENGSGTPLRSSSGYAQAPSSFNSAMSIYSQKLFRPSSASTYKPPAARSISRPSSAFSKSSPYSTMEPIVDTYHEQAIQEALHRLAIRQQARQYSSINSSSILRSEVGGTHSRCHNSILQKGGSLANINDQSKELSVDENQLLVHNGQDARIQTSSGIRYMSTEDYQASQRGKHLSGKPPAYNPGKLVQTNVHLQNANATFNNFIDESNFQWPSDTKSTYLTGVVPNNYHTPSANNRQHQLTLQQAVLARPVPLDTGADSATGVVQRHHQHQRLLEKQSRAMLEASKAKHLAMVAQAHAAQSNSAYSNAFDGGHGTQPMAELEASFAAAVSFPAKPPRPPGQPAPTRSKHSSGHRITRMPSADDVAHNFNFYNSLQYDMHTGQVRRKSDTKGK